MYQILEYFTSDKIDEIKKEVYRLALEDDRKDYIWKYYEIDDDKKINRIEYFVNYSPLLKEVSELFFKDSNYHLMKDKINFKHPQGEGFIAHQDITAGWNKYNDKHITIAIPLSDTTLENGCLFFAEGTYNKMLTPLFTDLTDDIVPPEKYKPYPTKVGDIIIFDSYIPHKSYKNTTNEPREILYFTYTPGSDSYEQYHSDKFKVVPPNIYRDKDKKYRSGNTFKKR